METEEASSSALEAETAGLVVRAPQHMGEPFLCRAGHQAMTRYVESEKRKKNTNNLPSHTQHDIKDNKDTLIIYLIS